MTNIVKNHDINKYVYSGYEITFGTADSWSFGNDFAWNAVIFVVDNISSSPLDNLQNNFLMLGENLLMILMVVLVMQRKRLVLTLVKQRQNVT